MSGRRRVRSSRGKAGVKHRAGSGVTRRLLALGFGAGCALIATTALAAVATDRWFYSWGDTVTITGDGMAPGESVGVDVDYPDGTLAQHDVVSATAAGAFADLWTIPDGAPDGVYSVVATGQGSGAVFTTTFDPGACSVGDPTATHCGPSSLVAAAASSSEIDLSWIDRSTNEDSFDVQRSLSNTFTSPVDVSVACVVNPNSGNCNGYHDESVTHADTGLQACTTYYYRVRAVAVNEHTLSMVYSAWSNTASATTSGATCGPTTTSGNAALTIGFWQNKNGQGIVKAYCGGTSGTTLAAFLTAYNPFQDMTATACNGEATYVYNVIKSANAGGSSMNAMLKAQMLATALDVYFSDPALGGNRIGAASPVGSYAVDLTQVCPTITPGTCTVAYEDTSSAFGGTTCQAVGALLTAAAAQSSSGGATWYANNSKATQGLAKDTFDAVNNQVAVTC
jgi:hypothetical protein